MKRKPINFPNPEYPKSEYLQLRWNDSRYHDDIFNVSLFEKVRNNVLETHEHITRRSGDKGICYCRLLVQGKIAKLDYLDIPQKNRLLNDKDEVDPGVLTIAFTDNSRTVVEEVIWEDENGEIEKNSAITTWDSVPYDDNFIMPKATAGQIKVNKKERLSLQNQFKEKLMDAYQRCCSISGCKTECALQAAHIFPAGNEGSFDVRNGLLLRADIHLLFDKGLIRIEPETLKIHLSKSVTDSEYQKFQGKKLRRTRDPRQMPDIQVLKWKWVHDVLSHK